MRAVSGDGLGAGAQRGDVGFDGEDEIDVFMRGGGIEPGDVVHYAFHTGYGGFFHHEIGELHFQVGGGGLELCLHGVKDVGDVLDVDDVAVSVQHFDEAAHVGAFEF